MAKLIDTSVFIEIERRKLPLDVLDDITQGDERTGMAAITASELLFGVYQTNPGARRDHRESVVELILGSIPVLPFDAAISRVHAALWSDLTRSGKLIGQRDMEIAATALALGWGVLTHNVREFARVPGLDVHEPVWPDA